MLMVVPCTECRTEGQFDIHLTFTYRNSNCNLHHIHTDEWTFYFCNIYCMIKWVSVNDVATQGIPCQNCHQTGWFAGFQQNGPCDVCKGSKRVLTCANK